MISSGLGRPGRAELLGICRGHGMRLVGPDCFGVANTSIGLDATLAARHLQPRRAGLALQSGGVGVVLLEHLSRLGVGISSFVSLGGKDDVSGNDMLLWFESDAATRLAVLYLESFGNPRKFARTALQLGRTMPILAVNAGWSAKGKRLAAARAPATVPRSAIYALCQRGQSFRKSVRGGLEPLRRGFFPRALQISSGVFKCRENRGAITCLGTRARA